MASLETKIMKIADTLNEASDLIPEYVFEQEMIRDNLKKHNEDLKQQILDKDLQIQDLKQQLDTLRSTSPIEKKKWWHRH